MKGSRLALLVLGLAVAVSASAANLVQLATWEEHGKIWVLSLDKATKKMAISVDWRPDVVHILELFPKEWRETSRLELDASAGVVNPWANYLVRFQAVDYQVPGAAPTRYFLRNDQGGVVGISCQIFPVEMTFQGERRPNGVMSYRFAGTYPMKPWFSFVWPMPIK